MGTFAIQLAKYFGAEVTGVDSTRKLEPLRSIGADHVIDYTQEEYTKSGQRHDLILDVVANRSILAYKRSLGPKGISIYLGGFTAAIYQVVLLVVPVVERRYPLSETPETLRHLEEGYARGKVVITLEHNNKT